MTVNEHAAVGVGVTTFARDQRDHSRIIAPDVFTEPCEVKPHQQIRQKLVVQIARRLRTGAANERDQSANGGHRPNT